MHNHDDKYPSRPGFEPDTTRLQAPVDTNEPSGPAGKKLMFLWNLNARTGYEPTISDFPSKPL